MRKLAIAGVLTLVAQDASVAVVIVLANHYGADANSDAGGDCPAEQRSESERDESAEAVQERAMRSSASAS